MQLKLMADEMKRRLANVEKGWVQRQLFGGLSIVLERKGDQWRLALGRTTTLPSTVEERVAEESFGVPAGTKWERGLKRERKKQQWLVTECVWVELPAKEEGTDAA